MAAPLSGSRSRYIAVTATLLALSSTPFVLMRRTYGFRAAMRFRVGMDATVLLQQAIVAVALRRHAPRRRLSLVDLMTLSRGAAAAALVGVLVSGVRDRRGPAGWIGWLSLLYGAILCDWLDGPIARRMGGSSVEGSSVGGSPIADSPTGGSSIGAAFDIEADSWLTLTSASAAAAWGGLPPAVLSAPLLRYLLAAAALRRLPFRQAASGEGRWERHTGIAQMLLFIGALAPFGGPATRWVVTRGTPLVTAVQILSLAIQYRRKIARA
jgi:phosphatidylglycerophosphate synthase